MELMEDYCKNCLIVPPGDTKEFLEQSMIERKNESKSDVLTKSTRERIESRK